MRRYIEKGGDFKMLESKKRANKKYNAKYKERVKTIRFDCYPPDSDITEYLEAKKAAGEPTATYLKRLIREDMQREAREEASEQFQNYFDNIVSKQLQGDTCIYVRKSKYERGEKMKDVQMTIKELEQFAELVRNGYTTFDAYKMICSFWKW